MEAGLTGPGPGVGLGALRSGEGREGPLWGWEEASLKRPGGSSGALVRKAGSWALPDLLKQKLAAGPRHLLCL